MPTQSPGIQPKRLTCRACLRPQSSCICYLVAPIEHVVEVVILQHPMEVHQAKGSARLLHLSLPNSRLLAGEVFEKQELQVLLTGPLHSHLPPVTAQGQKHVILLYPDTPEDIVRGMPEPFVLAPVLLENPSQLRLIVLDGTWRKSRKMLYLNPLLQQLPRLALRDLPASHYRIRKAHRPDQLSTLEATCAALAQLEGNAEKFSPLLTAFDGFVAQQLGYRLK